MWRVASEAYALAGHPFLTDTVLHNRKTDNDRQIINKQHMQQQKSIDLQISTKIGLQQKQQKS